MYRKSVETVLSDLKSTKKGLSSDEVQKRQEEYGLNELSEGKNKSFFEMVLDQFKDFIVIILIISAVISLVLGEAKSAITIFVVLILNATLGVIQQKKAESSLNALKKLASPTSKVLRNGHKTEVNSSDLTIGDIVLLDAGDFVGADGRIVESFNLQVAESALTGEAESVLKNTDLIEDEVPVADRINMVYSGTFVTYGRGVFVVTDIGMKTEIGKIATLISDSEERKTPIQVRLDDLGKKLSLSIVFVCAIIFAISIYNKQPMLDAFMFAVALAVAAVPEALASIVTISLAIGTNKMAKRNAIIRNLPVVEALGSAGVICSDKTGTLTQNKMKVVKSYIFRNGTGTKNFDSEELNQVEKMLIKNMVLCNDSSIDESGKEIGDPTETALINFGMRMGHDIKVIRDTHPRMSELSFDSDRKVMSTLQNIEGKWIMLTKGAPDVLLDRSSKIITEDSVLHLDDSIKAKIENKNNEFSSNALRVLAFAYKEIEGNRDLNFEDEYDLTFIGLVGMIDPPREEVKKAVEECVSAGIKTVMITGDHKVTAVAIAKELGIYTEGKSKALEGKVLESMSDKELEDIVQDVSVYARVSPEHKIRIVKAWQQKNMIVAMTGDGVNDAPALKQADIGIAMGIAGTEVAKEASGMILADDNFATIVHAIEGGRNILSNIKKSIAFLLTGNLSGVLSVLYFVLIQGKEAFLPVQLLFVNLATDSLPAISLAFEKLDSNVMKEKPKPADENLFDKSLTWGVLSDGIFIAVMITLAFLYGQSQDGDDTARTMAFSTLVLARLFHGFNLRSRDSIFKDTPFSNMFMIYGALIGIGMLSCVLYIPIIRDFFKAEALNSSQLGIVLMLSFLPTVWAEIRKMAFKYIFKI